VYFRRRLFLRGETEPISSSTLSSDDERLPQRRALERISHSSGFGLHGGKQLRFAYTRCSPLDRFMQNLDDCGLVASQSVDLAVDLDASVVISMSKGGLRFCVRASNRRRFGRRRASDRPLQVHNASPACPIIADLEGIDYRGVQF
jgi:hypothetical protein